MEIKPHELAKYKKIKYGESGSNGILFKFNSDKVMKIYTDIIKSNAESMHELVGLSNDTVIMPTELITCNGKVIGHLMKYIDASRLDDLSMNYSFRKFVDAYYRAMNNILKISKEHIYLDDVESRNILFKDDFFLIDNDFAYKYIGEDKDKEDVSVYLSAYNNLIKFNNVIMDKLKIYNFKSAKRLYKSNNILLEDIDALLKNPIMFYEFLEDLYDELANKYKEEVRLKDVTKLNKMNFIRK